MYCLLLPINATHLCRPYRHLPSPGNAGPAVQIRQLFRGNDPIGETKSSENERYLGNDARAVGEKRARDMHGVQLRRPHRRRHRHRLQAIQFSVSITHNDLDVYIHMHIHLYMYLNMYIYIYIYR